MQLLNIFPLRSESLIPSTWVLLRWLVAITAFYITSLAWLVFHRLVRSPVRAVPGPRMAAMTFLYEAYYDVWKKGQYTFKIKELHKQYGPVIRINPHEIHINDPEYYDEIYVGPATRKTDKWWWSANMFQVPESTFGTISHDLHRRRRAMYGNYFSTGSVHRLEFFLSRKIQILMRRLRGCKGEQKPVNLTNAYAALTIDIITAYCFGESYGCLENPNFAKDFHDSASRTSLLAHVAKQFPMLVRFLSYLPVAITELLLPDQSELQRMRKVFEKLAAKAIKDHQDNNLKVKFGSTTEAAIPKTVFESLVESNVPESEKSLKRLTEEAQLFVNAGTLTTAQTLMTITYHLLANPDSLSRLKAELATTEGGTPRGELLEAPHLPLKTLESLPYLNAVIREGLRLGFGVPHRLQRVSPDSALKVHGFQLPSGTPVSMSAMLMHENEEIFPNHTAFNPDRWLPWDTVGKPLTRYLVPFSKGSRQCVGINLAWAELYTTLGSLFGSQGLSLSLHDTVFARDIATTIDGFNPLPSLESNGLRVIVD